MQNKPRYNNPAIGMGGMDFGKVPPQAIDLETAVLGALLLESTAIYEISDILVPESFYKDEHQKIAQAILTLFQSDKKIDMLTVGEELRVKKQMDEVGGPMYLIQLMNTVGSASHIIEHYRIIKQKYLAREIIRIASNIQSAAFDESQDIDELLDFTNNEINTVNDKAIGKKQSTHISVIIDKSKEALRKREAAAKEHKLSGIKTPLIKLDESVQGWQSDVIVLAARPSQGKSAFALSIAKTAAQTGVPEPCD